MIFSSKRKIDKNSVQRPLRKHDQTEPEYLTLETCSHDVVRINLAVPMGHGHIGVSSRLAAAFA
jgi:hypothetical protein